jgi:uncharacterized protein YjbI with pentapeptide repeats
MAQQQKTLTQQELDALLTQHALWLQTSKSKGGTLSLSNYDLRGLSFEKAQLTGANLSRSNMSACKFCFADLESINMTESEFYGTNFYGANLKMSDLKYIKIDKDTNFDDAIYEGMMIDSPTAELLPVYMDKEVMQVIEEYRIQLNFEFPKVLAHIGRNMLDDFSDIIQAKYQDGSVKIKNERMDFQNLKIQIETINQEAVEHIQKDISNFQRVLRNEIPISRVTDDPILIERFNLNQKFREFQMNQEVKMLEMNNIVNEVRGIALSLHDFSNLMAGQMRNNLLPQAQGPAKNEIADCIVTLPNGRRQTLDAEKVVFVEKKGMYCRIFTTDDSKGFEVDELTSALASKLSSVCETIMIIHKIYIVNLKYVNKKVNDTNNYLIYTSPFPDKELVVGQNHKKRFNELIAAHHIALENK